MNGAFWIERWERNQIGFHQAEPNESLVRHAGRFLGGAPHRVLVPLCGKSVDLPWLCALGHEAVGVELSERAVRALLAENRIPFRCWDEGPFRRFVAPKLELWCGDWFALDPERLGPVDRVWDRAAMIAMPEELRGPYVAQLKRLAPGATMLLSGITYDPSVMQGPPFPVPVAEARERYGADRVELLAEADVLEREPRWKAAGHTWFRAWDALVHLPP